MDPQLAGFDFMAILDQDHADSAPQQPQTRRRKRRRSPAGEPPDDGVDARQDANELSILDDPEPWKLQMMICWRLKLKTKLVMPDPQHRRLLLLRHSLVWVLKMLAGEVVILLLLHPAPGRDPALPKRRGPSRSMKMELRLWPTSQVLEHPTAPCAESWVTRPRCLERSNC